MRRVCSQFSQRAVGLALAVAVLAVGVTVPAGASAEPKASLGSFGASPSNGSGGGQLSFARGVAVNRSGAGAPVGSVYVAEGNANHRISQFSADGAFVRAWGWDVVSSGPGNDVTGTPNEFEVCVPANGDLCKAGVTGAGAGQLGNPSGIAIDQTNGYLYVTSQTNRRVDVFSGTGQFAGAFGFDVLPGDPNPSGPDFCTTATGCQAAAAAGPAAGRFSNLNASIPAIDPTAAPGTVYVPDVGNGRVAQYTTTIAAGTLTAASFVKAFGWDVIPGAPAALESCTTVTGCQATQPTTGGANPGQFGPVNTGSPTAAAVDGTGAIYVASGPLVSGNCTAAVPCRIQKFSSDASSATDFGPASGPGQLYFTAGASPAVAGLGIAVDPSNDHVFVLRKESTSTYRVLEYDSAGAYVETHPGGDALPGATSNLGVGLAVGTGDRVYANLGGPNAGQVFILGPVPPPAVTIDPVTDVETTTATFNGTVTIPAPGSPTFTTRYHFEYSSNGVDWVSVPVPDANVGDGTTGVHSVSRDVTGLDPGTLYSVRLVATTGGAGVESSQTTFTTDSTGPRVAMAFVDEVTQTEARLGAHIDPEGLPTTYHFEWGATDSYGNRVPGSDRHIGDGTSVVIAQDSIDGLQPASSYHYRVVATSYCHPTGPGDPTPSSVPCVTEGPDRQFETLNACGLTDGRCYEMVSPPAKGPVGAGGDVVALGQELQFQVAPDEPTIEYSMAYGLPDATAGNEVVYMATRDDGSGWSSAQLAAPALVDSNAASPGPPSKALAMSSDLSCGFFGSSQPLGDDPPLAALEVGATVLYRANAGGTWTTVTDLVPSVLSDEPATDRFVVVGMSEAPFGACDRVVFRTEHVYPGVPATGERKLYEWENGTISYVGVIPGPGGPGCAVGACVAQALVGAPADDSAMDPSGDVGNMSTFNAWNAVSDDASRIYFTALSRVGDDVGQMAVFLREAGAVGLDVSRSQTVSPPLAGGAGNNDDSYYETASDDGSKVFFRARYGLASNADGTAVHSSVGPSSCAGGNGAGCDLYEYSVDTGKLTDLSVPHPDTTNVAGAGVVGVLGASGDGDYVYFAARGQLVPGEGSSEAANLANDTYSVYLAHNGSIEYVARISGPSSGNALVRFSRGRWSSRVTPDGSRMVFAATGNVTGDGVADGLEAYLYDAATGETVCLSCRRDGQPRADRPAANEAAVLVRSVDVENHYSPPRTITDDGRRVFFQSYDRLAVGGTDGQVNLYQWEDGQVSFLANSSPSSSIRGGYRYAGASRDGDDVYFTTVDRYTWQDSDGKMDVYDARVGGGFTAPPAPPDDCDPLIEGACQGPGAGGVDSGVETTRPGPGDPVLDERTVFSVSRLSKAQLRSLMAGRRTRLSVTVNRPGLVSLRGVANVGGLRATVIAGSRRAAGAGRVSVPVALSKAARGRIARTGSLKVTLTVRFSGAAKGSVSKLTFVKAGKSKGTRGKGRSRARRATSDRRTAK
jgi:hypothetical protein